MWAFVTGVFYLTQGLRAHPSRLYVVCAQCLTVWDCQRAFHCRTMPHFDPVIVQLFLGFPLCGVTVNNAAEPRYHWSGFSNDIFQTPIQKSLTWRDRPNLGKESHDPGGSKGVSRRPKRSQKRDCHGGRGRAAERTPRTPWLSAP